MPDPTPPLSPEPSRWLEITYRVPICPIHDRPMNQYSRYNEKPWIRYFKCNVDGCQCRGDGERREHRTG